MALKYFGLFLLAVVSVTASTPSATDLVYDVYHECLQHYSMGCVKPKMLAWMSAVSSDDVIHITEDLTIKKTGEVPAQQEQRAGGKFEIVDKFEDFLATHDLHVQVPAPLRPGGALNAFVPRALAPQDLSVPLVAEGRSSLMKKVIIPFFLGLKFKTAVLVPLALALIALKTWKALTLGLLSLVLSGAMVIFKFTKPKVVNYEVIHVPHHVEHHVEHPPQHWEHQGYGRSIGVDAQDLAYRGYN